MKLPRKLIRGRFLESLSQKDIRFVVTTLTTNGNEADGLLKLLSDEGTRATILENPKLYTAARKASSGALSQELYFYILLRRPLQDAGILLPEVVAFLAEALAAFPPAPRPGVHTSDYEESLKNAKDYEWFVLAVEVANRALILSGIYTDEIYKSKKNYAVAGLNRYENLARNYYLSASRHQLADEFELREILSILGADFVKVRTAMGTVREEYLKLTTAKA